MATWYQPPPGKRSNLPYVSIALAGVLAAVISVFWRHHARARLALAPERAPAPELLVSSGTIGVGGSLTRSLAAQGLPQPVITAIERGLRPLFDPRRSQATDAYEIHRTTSGVFVKMMYWPNKLEYYLVQLSSSGIAAASHQTMPTSAATAGVYGQIHDSLWRSMIQQEVPPEMINRFAELFSWRFDFLTEPRNGDTYKMVWIRESGNGAIRDGGIVCAYYHSKDRGDFYAFPVDEEYFDQNGVSLRGEFLRAPLAYRRISSGFTNRRFHPILRIWRPHHGIDYSAPRGTPASSIGDGVIVEILHGYNKGLGNEIRVRHGGSYVSIYGHLMAFAKGLHQGSHVKQGQVIGYVGSTGLSTGPHLHFGFEVNGQLIDFFRFKNNSKRKSIPPAERAQFDSVKRGDQSLLNQLTQPGAVLQILSTAKFKN